MKQAIRRFGYLAIPIFIAKACGYSDPPTNFESVVVDDKFFLQGEIEFDEADHSESLDAIVEAIPEGSLEEQIPSEELEAPPAEIVDAPPAEIIDAPPAEIVDAPPAQSEHPLGAAFNFVGLLKTDLDVTKQKRCLKLYQRLAGSDVKRGLVNKVMHRRAYQGPRKAIKEIRNDVSMDRIHRVARMMIRIGCTEEFNQDHLFAKNHIVNGGFELRLLKDKSWATYDSKRTPGWKLQAANPDDSCEANDGKTAIEFQSAKTRVLKADNFVGNQFAELDSHCFVKRGKDSRVQAYQVINTIPGATYTVSFLAAKRGNEGELQVAIDDWKRARSTALIEEKVYGADTEEKLERSNMKRYTFDFVARGLKTKVSFTDVDDSGRISFGVLLDDVSVVGTEK